MLRNCTRKTKNQIKGREESSHVESNHQQKLATQVDKNTLEVLNPNKISKPKGIMSENVSEGTDNVYKEDCYVDVENNNDCLYLGSNDQRNIHAKPFFPNFVPSQERNSTELLNMRIQPNQIPNNIYSFQPTESTLGFSYPQETSVYLADYLKNVNSQNIFKNNFFEYQQPLPPYQNYMQNFSLNEEYCKEKYNQIRNNDLLYPYMFQNFGIPFKLPGDRTENQLNQMEQFYPIDYMNNYQNTLYTNNMDNFFGNNFLSLNQQSYNPNSLQNDSGFATQTFSNTITPFVAEVKGQEVEIKQNLTHYPVEKDVLKKFDSDPNSKEQYSVPYFQETLDIEANTTNLKEKTKGVLSTVQTNKQKDKLMVDNNIKKDKKKRQNIENRKSRTQKKNNLDDKKLKKFNLDFGNQIFQKQDQEQDSETISYSPTELNLSEMQKGVLPSKSYLPSPVMTISSRDTMPSGVSRVLNNKIRVKNELRKKIQEINNTARIKQEDYEKKLKEKGNLKTRDELNKLAALIKENSEASTSQTIRNVPKHELKIINPGNIINNAVMLEEDIKTQSEEIELSNEYYEPEIFIESEFIFVNESSDNTSHQCSKVEDNEDQFSTPIKDSQNLVSPNRDKNNFFKKKLSAIRESKNIEKDLHSQKSGLEDRECTFIFKSQEVPIINKMNFSEVQDKMSETEEYNLGLSFPKNAVKNLENDNLAALHNLMSFDAKPELINELEDAVYQEELSLGNERFNERSLRKSLREKKDLVNSFNKEINEIAYGFTYVEFVKYKFQQLKVSISLKALLIMYIHSHLSKLEVIGILGGRVVSENVDKEICIEEALPCQNISESSDAHSVEIDPTSQVESQEKLEKIGFHTLGWYHSHPTFKTTPSQIDQETHLNHQNFYKGYPYVGVIIGPYGTERGSSQPKNDIFVFHVSNDQTYKLDFALQPASHLTLEDIEEIERTVFEYKSCKKPINFKDAWKKGMSYQAKMSNCIKSLLDENLTRLNDINPNAVNVDQEISKDSENNRDIKNSKLYLGSAANVHKVLGLLEGLFS